MKSNLTRYLATVNKLNKKNKRWKKVVSVLIVIAVFCTTYALILPAITLEANTVCGLEEHTHISSCYENKKTLICKPENISHVHTNECYDSDNNIVCGQSDVLLHTHSSICYSKDNKLICNLEAISEHIHTESCFKEIEIVPDKGHVHSPECYTDSKMDALVCLEAERNPVDEKKNTLVCDLVEIELHEHNDSCYEENSNSNKTLRCEKLVVKSHDHSESCFSISTDVLACTFEEHIHTDDCYTKCPDCGKIDGHKESCSRYIRVCSCGTEDDPNGEKCPVHNGFNTKDVYILLNGRYEKINEHSQYLPIDIESYNGQTVYILSSNVPSKIYLGYKSSFNSGAEFTLDNKEYVSLVSEVESFGNSNVVSLLLETKIPIGTEFNVKAESVLGNDFALKIVVIDSSVIENMCLCVNTSDEIGYHEDSCARKKYIKSLVDAKTAIEIYSKWDFLDTETQNDILDFLTAFDISKKEELKSLITSTQYNDEVTLPNGMIINSKGNTKIDAEITATKKQSEIINDLKLSEESENEFYFIDISAKQPSTLKISNIVDDNINKDVIVCHLLDSPEAIEELASVSSLDYFESDSDQYAKERAAAYEFSGYDNRVYYSLDLAKLNSNGDAVFYTESYSSFIFIVTFEYDGFTHSISGGTEISAQDVLDALELNYSQKQITKITFSDPKLFSATQSGGIWTIKSLESFGTTEFMYLTFSNGSQITIRLTDPIIYSYLEGTGEYSNMGTTHGYSHGSFSTSYISNTVGVLCDLVNYNNNSTVYADAVDVFVRPGTALKFTRWVKGFIAQSEAIGLEFVWTGTDCAITTAAHLDSYHFNTLIIPDDITEYTKYSFSISSYCADSSSSTGFKVTDVYIHVVPDNPDPEKLVDVLDENPELGLEIRELPITLYNFDGYEYNKTQSVRQFRGYSLGLNATRTGVTVNTSIINSGVGDGSATMGILKEDLDENGLPVWSFGENVDLFGPAQTAYKDVYENVDFQFVYDKENKYYVYSSTLNHAQFNESENKIELYRNSLASTQIASAGAVAAANTRGGFYPFCDITKAFLNPTPTVLSSYSDKIKNQYQQYMDLTSANTDLNAWKAALMNAGEENRAYFAQQPWEATALTSNIDMHFGMQFNSRYYIPYGKQIEDANGNLNDLIYEFSGDDDMWVFIDGKLVLDIGGGHTPIQGSINLTTGKVHIEKATQVESVTSVGTTYEPYEITSDFILNLEENTMHTLQFFYLETHSGVSNCYVRFNLPLIPNGAVAVSKDLTNEQNDVVTVVPDIDYSFRIETSADGGITWNPAENESYSISDTFYQTDSNGHFSIKRGETAIFNEIPTIDEESGLKIQVRVAEILPDGRYQYSNVNVNSENLVISNDEYISSPFEMLHEDTLRVGFENQIVTAPLEIQKKVVGGVGALINPNKKFDFIVTFDGGTALNTGQIPVILNGSEKSTVNLTKVEGSTTKYQVTFSLGVEEKILFPSIPIGIKYTVEEINPDMIAESFESPIYTQTDGLGGEIQQTVDFGTAFGVSASEFVVAEGSVNKVVVTNKHNGVFVEFPDTGGIGTQWFIFSGFALMFGAVLLLYKNKKRKLR